MEAGKVQPLERSWARFPLAPGTSMPAAAAATDGQGQTMIRTGEQYWESIHDGRAVFVSGERVADVTPHPQFKPLVDIRARIYDMAYQAATREIMSYAEGNGRRAVSNKLLVVLPSGVD